MKKKALTFAFTFIAFVCVGQEIELFGLEYARYPSASVSSIDSVESSFTELEISAFVSVVDKLRWTLLAGGTYRLVIPESASRQFDENLFFLALRLVVAYNLSESEKLILNGLPAISTTDEPGSFDGDNFLMQGGIYYQKRVNDRFSYLLGLLSTSRFGRPLVLPSVGFIRVGRKMKLDVNLPLFIRAIWNHQGTLSYGLALSVNGSQYNFNNQFFNGSEVDVAHFSRARLGPEFQYRIKGPLVLVLSAGLAANRTYDFVLEGSDYIDISLNNGPYVSAKIALRPKPNNN